ncbi:hypothetical protein PRIPAC_97428, partial [Pristionchus pacificus]|uniref:Protein kinase domain-containing protein n=1 Tax=Pristionchus pacificus TaxID=54126 RepID=A0A2A6BCW3_PRIPA
FQETRRFDEKLPNGGVTYTDGKGIEHFRGTNFRSLHGAILYDRYDLHHVIGMGTFGVVYRITDRAHEHRQMAMKVEPVSSQTTRQLAVIARLKSSPFTDEKFYIAQHYESFNIIISKVNHLCTVMDQYGCNVHQLLEDNKQGLPVTLCFIMLKQVLEGFSYLHEVACISHLDFKPENVVLLSWRRQDIKQGFDITEVPTIRIIDFNSATLQVQTYGRNACTIHYRPPEACLRLGVNRLADIWSVGCFAYFIHTRRTLFCNYTNIGVLLQHERTLDATPQHILMCAHRAGSHLIRPIVWGGRLRLFLDENLNAESLINSRPLRLHYNRDDFREIAYYALMRAMLEQDVDQRPTASQLLAMPIFNLPIIFQNNRRRPFFRRVHSLPTALIGRPRTAEAQF